MTKTPTVGLWHDRYHRYYAKYADTDLIGPLPGVTGAIGMKDKPAVAYWRGTTVATIIAENLDMYAQLVQTGGVRSAVDWAGKLPGHEADKAADTGTLVHILVEAILRKKDISVEPALVPYAVAFRRFLEERKPKVIGAERQIANLKVGYGGTLDLLLDWGNGPEVWDVKTWACGDPQRKTLTERSAKIPKPGSDAYAETAIQLSAYSHGEFVGVPDDPKRYRMPKITGHGVLHLRPDLYEKGYSLIPFSVTDAEWRAFRALLEVWRWQQERAKAVIGDPLSIRPKPEPSAPTAEAA